MPNAGNVERRIFEFNPEGEYGLERPIVVIAEVYMQQDERATAEIKSLNFSAYNLADFSGHVAALELDIYHFMEDHDFNMGQVYPAELPLPA